MRSGSAQWCAHLAGTRGHLAQPSPQPGGRLLGRVCPVEPFSIVPRILAGGCLAPPPGGDVTEKRSLYVGPHGKVQSVRWASRKSAVCMLGLTEKRTLSPPLPQNASFREIVPPECAFPYGTGCRMRFSVECAFPHLGKRRAASRKSAFCALGLTEKRSLHVGPHGKARSVRWTSRKGAVCPRHSRRVRLSLRASYRMRFSVRHGLQNALFRRVRFSSPGQTSSRLTQKRSLYVGPHGKAQSVRWASRKSAVCTLGLTEKRILCASGRADCAFP